MSGIDRDVTDDSIRDNKTEGNRTQDKKWKQRAMNILLLVILLGLFLLGFNGVMTYEGDIVRSSFTIHGTLPVAVLEMRPAHGETALVAIVAHGFGESKELMSGIGVELVHAGITTYLLDFPGHGESPMSMKAGNSTVANRQDNVKSLQEVADYVQTHNKATKQPRVILLGHAMGARAVQDYQKNQASRQNVIATILISPLEQPATQEIQNVLLLVGQNDSTTARSSSAQFLQNDCNPVGRQSMQVECGNPADGTGRRMVVIPAANDLTILGASGTSRETLNWLHRVAPQVKTNSIHTDTRLFWLLLGIAGIVLAMLPLCALLVEIFEINPLAQPLQLLDVALGACCLVIGITTAIGILVVWQPFSFLNIVGADYISSYAFISALITASLFFLIRRKLPIAPFKQIGRQVLLGLVLAIFLYCTLGQLTTFSWQRVTFTLARLWRFGAIFILVLPTFLIDEGISRGYQEHTKLWGIATSIGFKILLVGGLLIAINLTPGLDFLHTVLLFVGILFILLVSLGTQLFSSGKAALTGAILSALVIAWCMSTTFPIT